MREKLLTMLVRLLCWLPLSVSRALGNSVGWLAWITSSKSYKITIKNLEIAFPELSVPERKKMARESLCHSAQMLFEVAAVWYRDDAWRQKKTLSVTNEDLYLAARDSGRGVLFLVPHFGNWEMIGLRVGSFMKTTAMYAPPKIPELDSIMRSGRFVADMVPANVKGVLSVIKALRRGEMTFILPDQVPAEGGGIFTPFYGTPTYTMTLFQRLIQKTNPVVLIAYAIRSKGGFNLGYMEPDPEIYADDDQKAVVALNRSIERLIEKAPSQYSWEYKRYKKQPDGSNLYIGC